jgi:hypothetical protein
MKASKYLSIISRKILILTIGTLVVLGPAFSFPASNALAATPEPEEYVSAGSLKRSERWLTQLQNNMDKANTLIADYQNLFMEAGWQGVDTSSIEPELANFQSRLGTADPFISTAADILSTHDGFDDNGNVTDKITAGQTIRSANQAMLNAHDIMLKAGNFFVPPLRHWVKANPIVVRIENIQIGLVNDQNWLDEQQINLDAADAVVANVQDLITQAKAKGFGTSGLSSALSKFKDQVLLAKSEHALAASGLSTHDGYDDSGNVTNVAAASQTVHVISLSLHKAQKDLRQSGNLVRTLTTWLSTAGLKTSSALYQVYKLAYTSANQLNNSVLAENEKSIPPLDTRLYNLLKAFAKIP